MFYHLSFIRETFFHFPESEVLCSPSTTGVILSEHVINVCIILQNWIFDFLKIPSQFLHAFQKHIEQDVDKNTRTVCGFFSHYLFFLYIYTHIFEQHFSAVTYFVLSSTKKNYYLKKSFFFFLKFLHL